MISRVVLLVLTLLMLEVVPGLLWVVVLDVVLRMVFVLTMLLLMLVLLLVTT